MAFEAEGDQDRSVVKSAPVDSSVAWLRWLLAATVVVPVALFTFASWMSYQEHFVTARAQLERMVRAYLGV